MLRTSLASLPFMKTMWFSFGQAHHHNINGQIFDKDTLCEITSHDPRQTMFEIFGASWSMPYEELTDELLSYFPKGVVKLRLDSAQSSNL